MKDYEEVAENQKLGKAIRKWTGLRQVPRREKLLLLILMALKSPLEWDGCVDYLEVKSYNSPYSESLQATVGFEIGCVYGDQQGTKARGTQIKS